MNLPENSPPKLTEKLAAELRARAAEFGLVVTERCQWCGSPLWEHRSVAAKAGPTCRRRHKNEGQAAA
jgi:hypothetical protein